MKLTYKNNNGDKAVAKIYAKLVNNGDGTGTVEIPYMEAIKLASSLLYWRVGDSCGWINPPVALDLKAEEMLTVQQFAVKKNCGPKIGGITQTVPACCTAFIEALTADFRCVELSDQPVSKDDPEAPIEKPESKKNAKAK